VADLFAQYIADRMPSDVGWHFGGSYRRRAPVIGDIDFIVVNEQGRLDGDLFHAAVELPEGIVWQRSGKGAAFGDLTLEVDGNPVTMHIDLWACTPMQRGAFLWFCTGPVQLNMAMRRKALSYEMRLSQIGLLSYDKSTQLDDGTEEGVARLLDWPMMTPEERQRWASR
jgi:DNA polymerase/3'-5' exonuclease PolX